MKRVLQAALVAVALTAPAFAPVAHADVTVTYNPGGIAYGYHDGYWDREHHWQAWPNDQARDAWHHQYQEHYYDRVHTDLPNGGWREDTWWH